MVNVGILQWNARSLIANGQEFKKYVDELKEKPNIICVQETWLKSELDFIINGYSAVRRDRENGRGGGLVTFIQNGLSYEIINVNDKNESITIRIWTSKGSIDVINYYNPCGKVEGSILENIVGTPLSEVIWCGDFNAHNTLWGSNSTDANGLALEEYIDDKWLVCLNNGEGTRFNSINNTESVLDLTFVSSAIAGISTWNVDKETTIGSDHFPILIKVGSGTCQERIKNIPRWKIENANWEYFQIICAEKCLKLNEIKEIEINEFNNALVNEIILSAEETIPKSKGNRKCKNVPWWNDECSKAVKARNKAFKYVKKYHSQDVLIEYKRKQAVVRKTIKTQKRNFWRNFCNSIGRDVKLSDIWGMIRRMGGVRRNYELPVLKSGDKVAVNNLEKAEVLAQTFRKVHSSENLTKEAEVNRRKMLESFPDVLEKKGHSGNPLDVPLKMFELKKAVLNAKQTTPGKDMVCYKMVANMTDETLEIVLKNFNKTWEIGQLPSVWKHAIIVPILKPGKNPSDLSSYRPIALTSQLCKIMERIITDRMTHYLESNYLFSPYQSGFRKGRSTMDSLLCLESDIRKAQTNREVVIAVFFDVEKAYDMLWKEGLLIKLQRLGIGGKVYSWILDFLFNRNIQVKVGAEFSEVYTVENGTPQGSVCSPLLFNIMINDIFSNIDQKIGKSLYADDGALWFRGRNESYVKSKIQDSINEVEKWTNKWGFRLSVSKIQVICFSKKHKITPVSLKLYSQPLEQMKIVRFLGMWFDEKLTWKIHLEKNG